MDELVQLNICIRLVAGVALSKGDAVASVGGQGVKASNLSSSHRGLVRGISFDDYAQGETALVITYGPRADASWSWTEDQPIYLGANGALTQTRPSSGFIQQVAIAKSATEIFIDLQQHCAVAPEDLHYTHSQIAPSTTWDVTHNLGKRPSVTVADSAGSQVIGDVEYLSANALRITFSAAFSGTAYLN